MPQYVNTQVKKHINKIKRNAAQSSARYTNVTSDN